MSARKDSAVRHVKLSRKWTNQEIHRITSERAGRRSKPPRFERRRFSAPRRPLPDAAGPAGSRTRSCFSTERPKMQRSLLPRIEYTLWHRLPAGIAAVLLSTALAPVSAAPEPAGATPPPAAPSGPAAPASSRAKPAEGPTGVDLYVVVKKLGRVNARPETAFTPGQAEKLSDLLEPLFERPELDPRDTRALLTDMRRVLTRPQSAAF